MIVRQFLHWVRTASAGHRAEATGALARAYLYSDLSADERAVAEGAMIMLLDDPSPLVRRALAEALASSAKAPHAVILALASDQLDIATIVLEHSPRLIDADLVEIIASEPAAQTAVARRLFVPRPVAAALAEVGGAEACLLLVENTHADIAPFSIERIVERFGHLAAMREALLERADLPAAVRQVLVAKLAATLAQFVTDRAWLQVDRAQRVASEACEKATVVIAAQSEEIEVRSFVRHLRQSGQLTVGLILRALLSGNISLFEEALSDLSGVSLDRVRTVVEDGVRGAFQALYDRAGLPESAFPAFREALEALQEASYLIAAPGGQGQLKRGMIERVLMGCDCGELGDTAPLLSLLRRFATEAAREEARLYCEELVAEDAILIGSAADLAAA